MTVQHISGQDFNVMFGDTLIHVESMSANITDNRAAVQTRGIPDGFVNGDVSCSGDIELDLKNFNLIKEQAKSAGSFRDLPAFDIIVIAKTFDSESKTEFFGCLLKLSDILNVDPKGAEKSMRKIDFDVTDSDFVRIDGVPYLSESDTEGL